MACAWMPASTAAAPQRRSMATNAVVRQTAVATLSQRSNRIGDTRWSASAPMASGEMNAATPLQA